jgi:hypothetical protein
LRVGALRVFYEVASDTSNVVNVLAVGKKYRGLRVGRREIRS